MNRLINKFYEHKLILGKQWLCYEIIKYCISFLIETILYDKLENFD